MFFSRHTQLIIFRFLSGYDTNADLYLVAEGPGEGLQDPVRPPLHQYTYYLNDETEPFLSYIGDSPLNNEIIRRLERLSSHYHRMQFYSNLFLALCTHCVCVVILIDMAYDRRFTFLRNDL